MSEYEEKYNFLVTITIAGKQAVQLCQNFKQAKAYITGHNI